MNISKIIVSGRPRSGTSLMMHLLAESGYKCLRQMTWEETLGKKRTTNDYFYEHRSFVQTGDMIYMKGYDAGKVMPGALQYLPPDEVFVIWMDRNREDVLASQRAYNRESMISLSLEEDYDQWNVDELLAPFLHMRMSYEALTTQVRPR